MPSEMSMESFPDLLSQHHNPGSISIWDATTPSNVGATARRESKKAENRSKSIFVISWDKKRGSNHWRTSKITDLIILLTYQDMVNIVRT
jgi:hypothetical protein